MAYFSVKIENEDNSPTSLCSDYRSHLIFWKTLISNVGQTGALLPIPCGYLQAFQLKACRALWTE
jgi:hypothetical protein